MPLFTATKIHDGYGWLPEGTTVELNTDGTVIGVHDQRIEGATHFDGVLAPGFVNVHCHLELSHMKGVANERTGLIPFLRNIPQHRDTFSEEQKREARHRAFDEMLANGIVAVGDIANTTDTLDLRAQGKIHFQTFIEALGFNEAGAHRALGYAEATFNAFAKQQSTNKIVRQSIVPHAPYSVSSTLFKLIDGHQPNSVISIHNQESEEENKFYMRKEGKVRELLAQLGIDDGHFTPTGKPSLESYMQWLSPNRSYVLVHNTYSDSYDIECARTYAGETHWCLCPNANLYIEGRLPDINNFISEGVNICIGTDSLASNHVLSVLSELTTIKEHYPQISWETLLHWGTVNGAKALQMNDLVGTLRPGMKPGLILLSGLDTEEKPAVRRIA